MAKWFVYIVGVLGLCWRVIGITKYDNYTLVKITPFKIRHLNALKTISSFGSHEVNVLKRSHGLNDTTDILVSPKKKGALKKLAIRHGMTIQYKDHYGRLLEPEATHLRTQQSADFHLFDFNSYDAITDYIIALAKKKSHLVQLETLGNSYEGRKMSLVKISADHKAGNPVIFIDAGAHAREWAGPVLAMYLIDRLANDAGAALGGVDWYILPFVNPDGYEYTRKNPSNRMWRKTRSKTKKKGCFGVDLNRNYGYKWGVTDVSFNPCDLETYAGPYAFSERESRIVRKVMKDYSNKIKLYVSIHTYGQYLVYPWGYTGKKLPSKWKKLHKLAKTFSKSVVNAGGDPFKVSSSGQWYPAAGESDDYAFGGVGIPYAYTLEITDGYEFIFPAKLLSKVMPPYFMGFKTFAKAIKKEFGKIRGRPKFSYNNSNTENLQCSLQLR